MKAVNTNLSLLNALTTTPRAGVMRFYRKRQDGSAPKLTFVHFNLHWKILHRSLKQVGCIDYYW